MSQRWRSCPPPCRPRTLACSGEKGWSEILEKTQGASRIVQYRGSKMSGYFIQKDGDCWFMSSGGRYYFSDTFDILVSLIHFLTMSFSRLKEKYIMGVVAWKIFLILRECGHLRTSILWFSSSSDSKQPCGLRAACTCHIKSGKIGRKKLSSVWSCINIFFHQIKNLEGQREFNISRFGFLSVNGSSHPKALGLHIARRWLPRRHDGCLLPPWALA